MKVFQRPFTGAARGVLRAFPAVSGLILAILICPSVGTAQDRVLTGPELKSEPSLTSNSQSASSTAHTSSSDSPSSDPPAWVSSDKRWNGPTFNLSESRELLDVYDASKAENSTAMGESIMPTRKGHTFYEIHRNDVPGHKRFDLRSFIVDTKTYSWREMDYYDSRRDDINGYQRVGVNQTIDMYKENSAKAGIPPAKLRITESGLDQGAEMVAGYTNKRLYKPGKRLQPFLAVCMEDLKNGDCVGPTWAYAPGTSANPDPEPAKSAANYSPPNNR